MAESCRIYFSLLYKIHLLLCITCISFSVVSLLEPLLVNTDVQSRLVAISLGMVAPYILLSTGYPFKYKHVHNMLEFIQSPKLPFS